MLLPLGPEATLRNGPPPRAAAAAAAAQAAVGGSEVAGAGGKGSRQQAGRRGKAASAAGGAADAEAGEKPQGQGIGPLLTELRAPVPGRDVVGTTGEVNRSPGDFKCAAHTRFL